MDLRGAKPKGVAGTTASSVRTSLSALDKLAALVEAQQLQAREDNAAMQQQQQVVQEAARTDRGAVQALMAQVLQLRGETTTIASTVPNATLGNRNTGTPDTSVRPQAGQPHVPLPHKLSSDATLREFKVWRSAWSDYEELLHLRNQPHRTQLAHLRSCLTPEMRSTLAHAIAELADDAELCETCLDAHVVTRITSGIWDQQTRKRLLAIDPPPELSEAVRLCRCEQSSRNANTDLAGSTKTVQNVTRRQMQPFPPKTVGTPPIAV
ncbi:hypothetical protein Hamer_G001658 [Homarus americanus]|uniref:Uncharacterized protein n=1 Tax=Homarus americanus TaxID=6706 RepID=A0A8J5MR11_HOMAM|nr:hypothetical protein Hamer_G001658 [Homarus americanus]